MLVFVLEFDIEFNAGKIKQNEKLVISWLPLPMSETPYFTFQ